MSERIDWKILQGEISGKIREFYPYFFGFYLLSVVVSYFSKTWSSFFYWPAFHGSIIFFTLLFILTWSLNLWQWCDSAAAALVENFSHQTIALLQQTGAQLQQVSAQLERTGSRWQRVVHWRRRLTNSLQLVAAQLHLYFVVAYARLSGRSHRVGQKILLLAAVLFLAGRQYIVSRYFKMIGLSRLDRGKIVLMLIILIFSLGRGIYPIDFLVLFYALLSLLFILDSRLAAGLAVTLLVFCPFLLLFKKDILAANAAIYVYYFLVIAVLTQLREAGKDKKDACG